MASTSRKRSARSRQQDEQSSAAAVAEEEEVVAVAGMEAWRFGFSKFSEFPAFKFDPTDADIVASYLLPRALYGRGHDPSAAVIEDDVSRCEPWTLMREHGHAASAHAFFVHDHPDSGGGRRKVQRAVKNGGGVWRIQKGEVATLTIVRDGDGGGGGGGGELDVVYKRRNLSFHRHGESSSSGWVMHEYEITSPPLNATVLSRIRATSKAKDKKSSIAIKEDPVAAAAAGGDGERTVPNPDYSSGGHQLADCNNAGAGDSANHHSAGGDSNHGYYGGDNSYGSGGVVQYNPDQLGPSHQYCYGEQVAGNGFVAGDGEALLHLYEGCDGNNVYGYGGDVKPEPDVDDDDDV